jgi:hypothetical protein
MCSAGRGLLLLRSGSGCYNPDMSEQIPRRPASAGETAITWRRGSVRTAAAAERDAAIAYWAAQMPDASAMGIAGYAGTNELAVRKWREANADSHPR